MKTSATITHLYHSGYAVEAGSHFFVFDYYQPKGKVPDKGILTSEYLKTKDNVYVFSSHSHFDHYDPVVLQWTKQVPALHYIFSDDIKAPKQEGLFHYMGAYGELAVNTVKIKTFGSTDQGVSFLVESEGLTVFHAGDLNWWHWKGESKKEQQHAETIFKAEMEKIAGHTINIAFFPVDRRLEEFYSLGAEYFAAKIKPDILFPMHFGHDFAATKAFAEKAKELATPTVEITHNGQTFTYPFSQE